MAEDIKKILTEYKEETNRHFDVVAEDLKDEIRIVAEQVANNTEKIETLSEQVAANTEKLVEHDQRFELIQRKLVEHDQRFELIQRKLVEHDQRFNKIDDALEVVKLDIEFIKNDLKQKVGRDEFVVLEKRVSMLEARQK